LSKNYEIVKLKDRLLTNKSGSNKVFLVNIIVRDPTLRPVCVAPFVPSWWGVENGGKCVEMICEVQITLREIFYLEKQTHGIYEIYRCNSFLEYSTTLEQCPSSEQAEVVILADCPLYDNPNFAF